MKTSLCVAVALAAAVAGCHDGPEYNPENVQTLEITLAAGTNLGTEDNPNADRNLRFDVTARNRKGEVATELTGKIQSYVFFLGALSPDRSSGASSLQEIMLVDGIARDVTLNLPTAYGPSSLWLEDEGEMGRPSTFAVGATPTIWYREPYLSDVQRPPVPATRAASPSNYRSSLEGKQVRVNQSQWGANGKLVVTSVATQAYTVSDVQCGAGGVPPCMATPLGHMYVFTFGKPPVGIDVGTVLKEVRGGVSEFVGFTELNFPRQDILKDDQGKVVNNPAFVPAPTLLTSGNVSDNALMEDNEAGLVELRNVRACAPKSADDLDRWERFGQFPIDMGGGCGAGSAPTIATRPISSFNPLVNDGVMLTKVVGNVRNVSGASSSGSFSFWTINIRTPDDLECAVAGCKGM